MTRPAPLPYPVVAQAFALALDKLQNDEAARLELLLDLRAAQGALCAEVAALTATTQEYRAALTAIRAAPSLDRAKSLAAAVLHAPRP